MPPNASAGPSPSTPPSSPASSSPWRHRYPPATCALILLLCLIYSIQCQFFPDHGSKRLHKSYNLKPHRILHRRQYYRLVTCHFFHRDLFHLGRNIMGLWYSGTQLERTLGTRKFIGTALASIVLTSCTFVVLSALLDALNVPRDGHDDKPYFKQGTKGFSGVLFHWTALECYMSNVRRPGKTRDVFGLGWRVPTMYYPWVMTVLLRLVDKRSNWLMHSSGIVVGMAHGYLEDWLLLMRDDVTGEGWWGGLLSGLLLGLSGLLGGCLGDRGAAARGRPSRSSPSSPQDAASMRRARLERFQAQEEPDTDGGGDGAEAQRQRQRTRRRRAAAAAIALASLLAAIGYYRRGGGGGGDDGMMAEYRDEEL